MIYRWLLRKRIWGLPVIFLGAVAVILSFGGVYVVAQLGGSTVPQVSGSIELERGLIGHWKLDGNAKDSTPYANDGTLSGVAPTMDRGQNPSSAYSFDGSNDYISIGQSINWASQDYSVSVWFKLDSLTATGDTPDRFRIFYGSQTLNFLDIDVGGANFSFIGETSTNNHYWNLGDSGVSKDLNWHNLTITFTDSTVEGYIDGNLFNSIDTSGVTQNITINQLGRGYVGGTYGANYGDYWLGKLDDLRVYDRVLNSNEAQALYDNYAASVQVSDLQRGLLAHYKLDGNVLDSSPFAHNGSLVGGPSYISDRKGLSNSALGITDGTDKIDNAGIDLGNDWTVSVWSPYPNNGLNETGHWRTLTRGNGGDHQIIVQNGSFALGSYDNTGATNFRACSPAFNVNSLSSGWHHFLVTQTGGATGDMTFYVDGIEVCSISGYGSTTDIRSIGNHWGNGQEWGTIDDFRVYNRALSEDEIGMLYDSYDSNVSVSDLQRGLVGDWSLNGNTLDSTPYSNNGSLVGAPTLANDRKGRANSAYTFDGSDCINTGTSSLYNDLFANTGTEWSTVVWFKYSGGAGGDGVMVGRGGGTGSSATFALYVSSTGDLRTRLRGNLTTFATGYDDGEWHSAAITWDGTTARAYVDGVFDQNVGVNTVALQTNNVTIGGTNNCSSSRFVGDIDDVRIWNRALSATEIELLFDTYR